MILVADEYFLIAHDEFTGRSRVYRRALELALAAGMLAELMPVDGSGVMADPDQQHPPAGGNGGFVDVQHDGYVFTRRRDRVPDDPLGHQIFDLILREPPHTVRTWLAYLAQDARDQVGRRLVHTGRLFQLTERRIWRRARVYPAVDPSGTAFSTSRLARVIRDPDGMPVPDMMLSALVVLTELADHVLHPSGGELPRGYLPRLLTGLPEPLRTLTRQTQAILGAGVLGGR